MNIKIARLVLLGAAFMSLTVFLIGCGNSDTDSNAGQNNTAPVPQNVKKGSKHDPSSFTSPT